MKTIIFDCETVLDVAAANRCHYTPATDEFAPWPLHSLACISWLTVERIGWDRLAFSIESVSRDQMSERAMLDRLEQAVADANSVITFNGRGFDVPVLLCRAAISNIAVPTIAQLQTKLRLNFHIDVAEAVSANGLAPRIKLSYLCAALDIPVKLGAAGNNVAQLAAAGNYRAIADYCETDAVATWLAWEMWQTSQIPDHARERWAALAQWVADAQPRLSHLLPYTHIPELPKAGGLAALPDDDGNCF